MTSETSEQRRRRGLEAMRDNWLAVLAMAQTDVQRRRAFWELMRCEQDLASLHATADRRACSAART